jgi:hypothetical protein
MRIFGIFCLVKRNIYIRSDVIWSKSSAVMLALFKKNLDEEWALAEVWNISELTKFQLITRSMR